MCEEAPEVMEVGQSCETLWKEKRKVLSSGSRWDRRRQEKLVPLCAECGVMAVLGDENRKAL